MQAETTVNNELVEFRQDPGYASKRLAVFALAGLSLVFLTSALYTPATGEYFTICGFKNFTGLPCPGCGLTHSFCALAKGDVTGAFAFNLMGPFLFALLVLVWVRAAGVLLDRTGPVRRFDEVAERIRLLRLVATTFLIYGGARIAYLLLFDPHPFHESPVSKFVAGLFR